MTKKSAVLLALAIVAVVLPSTPAAANFDPLKCGVKLLNDTLEGGPEQRGDDPCAPDFNECWEDYHGVYVSSSTGSGWADAQDLCEEAALGEASIRIVPQGAATGTATGVANGKAVSLHVATGIMTPVQYQGSMCYESDSRFDRPGAFPGTDGTLASKCA